MDWEGDGMTRRLDGALDYEKLFNQVPIGLIIANTDGVIHAVNDAFVRWTGCSRQHLLGTAYLDRFPEEQGLFLERQLRDPLEEGRHVSGLAVQLVDLDQVRHPVVLAAARREGAPGGPQLDCIAISKQGPEDRNSETVETALREPAADQEIRRNEALLRAVLDTVGVGVAVTDPDGRPLLQNSEFKAILQHAAPGSPGEAEEADLLVFGPDGTTPVPPEKRFLVRLGEGESFSEELVWIGPEGDRRAISVTGRAAHNDSFDGSVTAFDDITQLATALRAKDDFIGAISHELRTPLTTIMGHLELALDEDLPPHLRRSLDTALGNSQRLLQLVTDLLAVARGHGIPEKQKVDLTTIIKAGIQAVAPRAEARDIRVIHELPESLPVCADPKGLARVLENLLSNAIKFSHPRSQVAVRACRRGQDVVMDVSDSGIGMSEQEQRDAFTRFFRSTQASRAAIPGAGLGLPIAKAIVEAHQGTVTVASRKGHGSTFSVTMPDIPR